ncbi:hypothetical protein OV090_08880 [Nannocystis sp. RBIL2]|uniref:hypothetical protein n=1 Tax=Nannocystis sp. RBIL2 TaxID=2996788 RepID=UPI00226D812B|nr:hypothetical protein [Nannocystis sp. RBIL2]MCY1064871.1 hypothetical protein [Nannocystis sp. RBIL2]
MPSAALALLLLADPGWLELRWPEVVGCPTAAEVAAAAERLAAVGSRRPVVAEAVITVDDTGYSLALAVQTADGVEERRVHNARCEPLADATAVIVAVAAEPAGSGTSRPARDEEIPPGLRRTPPPEVGVRPAVGAFVAAVGAVGPPRSPAPGLQAGLLVLWPRARSNCGFTTLSRRRCGWRRCPRRGRSCSCRRRRSAAARDGRGERGRCICAAAWRSEH